jgi:autotransporter-associated beta strand protein
VTIAGTISGAGMLTIFNTSGGPNGNVVLTGTNTYTGGTFICSCGTLTLGDPTHTASILGDVTNDGTFRIVNANTSGITSITTEFGATTNFFNNTSAGTATITTVNGGLTQFFNNSTGGNAQFNTDGSSVVDFSGSTGPNGDGRITAGSIAGAGIYVIGAGNTLIVGGNNLSTVVSGSIVDSCGCGPGSGNLVKVGSGTLTLSGSNFYTGTTTVNGGFLDVEGFIISPTTVNAGGALTGAGLVADVTIAGGGVFLPGNGFGTSMAVNGDLTFQPGALYLVQLTSTTSTSAAVSGTANLAGQVGASFAPGSFVSKQQTYTILTAGGINGTFGGVTAPGGLIGMLSYDPNDVFLNFDLNWGAKYNLNANQRNVAKHAHQLLQRQWRDSSTVRIAFAVGIDAGLRRARDRCAAVDLQRDEPVHLVIDRSIHCRPLEQPRRRRARFYRGRERERPCGAAIRDSTRRLRQNSDQGRCRAQ